MPPSDTEDDVLEDNEDDLDEDADNDLEEELFDAINEEATEDGDDDSSSSTDDGFSDDNDDDDDESEPSRDVQPTSQPSSVQNASLLSPQSQSQSSSVKQASPPLVRKRSLSPARARKRALYYPRGSDVPVYRTCIVEAVCAIPHPVPIHALASSHCMTHLLTGSDDGYIRDYDIFTALNGKNFLTAPQRHHSGVVEGIMKSGQLRFWWENPTPPDVSTASAEDETGLSPVYCLAMHSDALWALAGSDSGPISLYTVRHDPGRLCHVMSGHRGPVSALSLDHDEKGFFSAGWDGDALLWDLNTGQKVRNFTSHGAQLTGVAVRPTNAVFAEPGPAVVIRPESEVSSTLPDEGTIASAPATAPQPVPPSASAAASAPDSPSQSDGSFDDLFDEPENNTQGSSTQNKSQTTANGAAGLAVPPPAQPQQPPRPNFGSIAPSKNAPPLLDPDTYMKFSPDILLTASIDGQVILWDKRVNTPGTGVGRLWMNEKTPPWCLSACWSADGGQIYAGRRNGTVDVWDVRQLGRSGPSSTPRLLKTLRNPPSSGVVSCVVAFPDNKHIACASIDNLRLWNVDAVESDPGRPKTGMQFKIIPGHHGGYISNLLVDPGGRFLVSASSNRGWHGESTRTVFVHDIKHVQ